METQCEETRNQAVIDAIDPHPNLAIDLNAGFPQEAKKLEENVDVSNSGVYPDQISPLEATNEQKAEKCPLETDKEGSNLTPSTQDPPSDSTTAYVDPAFIIKERPRTTYSFSGTSLKKQQRASINSTAESSNTSSSPTDTSETSNEFSCNICFDAVSYPVLTLCGHLYCWPCLHQWIEAQPRNPLCPVCKAGCGEDKVIPVYGRGKEAKDPRTDPNCPKRPAGQRPEPTQHPSEDNNNGWGGINMGGVNFAPFFSIGGGFGFLPGLFGFHFTFPPAQQVGNQPGGDPQQAFFTRLLIMVGLSLLVSIFFS
ncbi:hypothetical protein K493DRAFT_261337 [Basidiobolus meristosporus CBS 931.73]|uniref:RING-type E3 ubiquitin transferase n=1 Tax=Basidiobolus meristosporus CBS 931.73 TaxID=1314790 RepID=A0A1Y1Y9B1_9FUNG|nr:hypothetical protein K493DRAFT_261337 [Basidiobolus meristosporus CBS 931.73]|eukprot:ORX94568.1 hypothetical protein K493DRAFT_261337 [Basidiobolus meristosporus CBS 931.73]